MWISTTRIWLAAAAAVLLGTAEANRVIFTNALSGRRTHQNRNSSIFVRDLRDRSESLQFNWKTEDLRVSEIQLYAVVDKASDDELIASEKPPEETNNGNDDGDDIDDNDTTAPTGSPMPTTTPTGSSMPTTTKQTSTELTTMIPTLQGPGSERPHLGDVRRAVDWMDGRFHYCRWLHACLC